MRLGKIIIALIAIFSVAAGGFILVARPHIMGLFMKKVDFFAMYQNLANPYIRYVYIPEGLRKEEVANIYKDTLAWNNKDVEDFLNTSDGRRSELEGFYFPTTYVLPLDASGEEVKEKMIATFNKKVDLGNEKVNVETILKVASLIQREAAGKHDMNLISGIIWNRIWNGMSLDIDATLQYAKGDEERWWPQVYSKDKQIASSYNTYKTVGLPPTPISNPGLAAIKAAYNPQKTSCIFYFHDRNRKIHCSRTYKEHKAGVEVYLR